MLIMKQKYQINNNVIASDVEFFVDKGYPLPFARVLSSRGVTSENWSTFFAPTFYDAFEMLNMDKAVEIVGEVMQTQGSVLIYGDYDADGLSASALLSLFFTNMGVENSVIIPTREQGYGLHCDLIFKAFEQNWYDLLITVDCGISNKDEVEQLKEAFGDGVDIVVTDHHEIPEMLPNCVCVNPKLGYPFAYLSGSGVAYKLVEALVGREQATKYADLAIIGTIADMMPMLDENRALTNLGLANFNHRGLRKLAELSNCKDITTKDVALRISPKINAAGRVGNPYDALTLLLLDERVPSGVAEKLLEANEIRRTILEETIVEAEGKLDGVAIQRDRLVFIAGDNWQHGILGIVANRLREKYNYPTLVMCRDGDNYVGSARGVEGLNLHSLFVECQDLLVKFGGHKSSVGFSVEANNMPALKQRLVQLLQQYSQEDFASGVVYDVDMDDSLTLLDAYEFCCSLQPTLPSDVVKFRAQAVVERANVFGKERNHVSITLTNGLELKGFFDFAKFAPALKTGAEIDVVFTLEKDSYSGNVCGIIVDLTLLNSLHFEDLYKSTLLSNYSLKEEQKNIASSNEIVALLQQNSTLAVFDSYQQFCDFSKLYSFDGYSLDFFVQNKPTFKSVVIAPNKSFDYSQYNNVVVFGNYTKYQRIYTQGARYIDTVGDCNLLKDVKLDRNVCVAVYVALKNKNKFEAVDSCYTKYLVGKCTYPQFVASIKVFEELNLIDLADDYNLVVYSNKKVELQNSKLFNLLSK